MKKWMALTMCAVLGVSVAQAAMKPSDLAPEALAAAVAGKPRAEQRALTQQALEAIGAMAMAPEAKMTALVEAARALIGGGKTVDVIAEVFNSMPIEYLPAVAELLAEVNFAQDIQDDGKPWPDAQFDTFAANIAKSVSRYIEVSGTDSPALRIGIFAATFTQASNDPNRTMPKVIAALPTSMQAAAQTYVGAQMEGNLDLIAAAAGVDAVEETPAEDPSADRVVTRADATDADAKAADEANEPAAEGPIPAEMDYLDSPDPAPKSGAADEDGDTPDEDVEVKVPLLARYSTDVLGIALDSMMSTMYDWDNPEIGENIPPSLPGFGVDPIPGLNEQVPTGFSPRPRPLWGDVDLEPDRPAPSPGYDGQGNLKSY